MLRVNQMAGFAASTASAPTVEQIHPRSVSFNGSDEYVQSSAATLGITDTFSIMVWVKLTHNLSKTLIQWKNASDNNDRIDIGVSISATGGGRISFLQYDSSGVIKTNIDVDDQTFNEVWHQIVVTRNGNGSGAVAIYVDGSASTLTTNADTAGATYADTARLMTVAANQAGGTLLACNVHSIAVWDAVLASTDVTAIFNDGGGNTFLLDADSGTYNNSADLQHWWRMGLVQTDAGMVDDSVGVLHLDTTLNNISTADIETDAPEAGAVDPGFSIDFDGSTEWMYTNTSALGIANAWSIAVWLKPADVVDGGIILAFRNATTPAVNFVSVEQSVEAILVRIYGSDGTTNKRYRFNNTLTAAWHNVVVTWDGSTLKGYQDATEASSPSKIVDGSVTMTDTTRQVSVGAATPFGTIPFPGLMHSVALWSSALDATNITAIYNSGDGTSFDLLNNSGGYDTSGDLVHWWALGFDPGNLGLDRAGSLDLDNLNNIDAPNDRVEDSPT